MAGTSREGTYEERQRAVQINGMKIWYDYIHCRYKCGECGDRLSATEMYCDEIDNRKMYCDDIGCQYKCGEWEAICFVDLHNSSSLSTLTIRPARTKVVEACFWPPGALAGPVSMMDKADYPTLRPMRKEELPDSMDDIYVIAYGPGRRCWVLCVCKDDFSEGIDDHPFRIVEGRVLQLKYNYKEVAIWLDKLKRTAMLVTEVHESRYRGGSRGFQVAMGRLEY